MPVMPVFGGGWNLFQPVYVGDIARAVEVISRDDPEIRKLVDGKIIEAGGPDGRTRQPSEDLSLLIGLFPVMSFREVIQAVLHTKKRWRPIVSLPYFVGQVQAQIFERLPQNGLTITRDQACAIFPFLQAGSYLNSHFLFTAQDVEERQHSQQGSVSEHGIVQKPIGELFGFWDNLCA